MYSVSDKELREMSRERLIRKMNQYFEMSGMARQDGDKADAKRQMKEARRYEEELISRGG